MVESYYLGIDIGTVRVAAAHARPTIDDSVVVTQVQLGHRSDHVPSVAFVALAGELLFGDTAERRGLTEPERLVREFTRSIGDDVPLSVGGRSLDAGDLFARTVEFVIASATESIGTRPSGVTVTHPATWGPHRVGVVRGSLDAIGLRDVDLMTAREAAVRNYEASHVLDPGRSIVTCDVGGTTFNAAVTRKGAGGALALAGRAFGIDNLGGADFDDMVFHHVLRSCGAGEMDLSGEGTRDALLQLRRECVDAKEALSFDTEVTIPVFLPQRATKIRLTRSEFEAMIERDLDRMVGAVDDAVESAGLATTDLDAIVLVGGSARIPRIAQRLSEFFDRPIVADQDPKASTAMGAARVSLSAHGAFVAAGSTALALREAGPSTIAELVPVEESEEAAALAIRDADGSVKSSHGRWWAGVALATLAVSGLVLISGTLLSEFGADDDEVSPRAAAFQTPTTAGPSATSGPPDTPSMPEATPTPAAVVAPEPVSGVSHIQPTSAPETVRSYVTTESYTTVTAAPSSGTPTTQRTTTTPPTQTTSSTPTTQSPDPTTPAPTTQTPDPTTPAPTTQTPDPTTPAPTTQTPDPTTPAPTTQTPDPTTPAPDPTPPATTSVAPEPTQSSTPATSGPEITPV